MSAGLSHSFCCRLLLVVPVLFRLLSFAFVRFCAGLLRLLLGSEVMVVFEEVTCDEPIGNKQMAHSQIVVLIKLSLVFDMDVALVIH